MFSALYNKPDREIVKDAEGRAGGFWARYPMKRLDEVETKGASCKLALQYLGARDEISRDLYLLKEELQQRYICPKPPESGDETADAVRGLYANATVEAYLDKHPEDASSFGLNGYRPDMSDNDFKALSKASDLLQIDGEEKKRNVIKAICGTFRNEREQKILDKTLEQFLFEKPDVGKHLGDKALAFRIQATLRNLKKIDNEYKKLLSELPKLKKKNGFPVWAGAYHSVRHGLIRSLWWVRDHPVLVSAIVSVLVLLKIGFALFLIEKLEFGHKDKDREHKKEKSVPPPPPRPQPYPKQYPSQPYYPQPYYPQQYAPPQAPVYPAPFFQQSPTPLQTALNVPTP